MALQKPHPSGLAAQAVAWIEKRLQNHPHLLKQIRDYVPGSDGMVQHANEWHTPDMALATDLTAHAGSTSNPHSTSDANLVLTDVTTNNASTSKHGFCPKFSGVSTQFLNGEGNYTAPAGGSSSDARLTNDGRIERASDTSLTWSGYAIGLWDATAGSWVQRIPGSVPALANTDNDLDSVALTYDANYDVFATATDGTTNAVSLVCKKWTNATTRAVTPALWQGRYCYDNSTDAGKRRLWLGTIRLRNDGGTAKFTDSSTQRFVANTHNKQFKYLWTHNNTQAQWTYASTTFREANNGTTQYRAEFVLAEVQDLAFNMSILCGQTANVEHRNWVKMDGTTSPANYQQVMRSSSTDYDPIGQHVPYFAVTVGYHYATIVEATNGGTGKWWGWQHCNAQTMMLC